MMRWVSWMFLLLVLPSSALLAQNSADLSLTMTTKDGHTIFRLGEDVEVELRFEARTPKRYKVWDTDRSRTGRVIRFDHFFAEPSNNAVDPLRDAPDRLVPLPAGTAGGAGGALPLNASYSVFLHLNEFLSFRRPGQYRIYVETSRAETVPPPLAARSPLLRGTPVLLRSNMIEIEIAAPERGWAEKQLQQATATLSRGDPRSVSDGLVVDPPVAKLRTELALAGRTLRFLETRDAADAMAHFYENGPQGAQEDIRFGLFASPYRNEVIQAMERSVAAPNVPITSKYFNTLIQLLNLSEKKPSAAHVMDLQKLFQAKQVSNQQAAAPPPFTDDFSSLQPRTQQELLTRFWPEIAAPTLKVPLQAIAEGTSDARNIALLRTFDLDPDVARSIVIERIRKMDFGLLPHQSITTLSPLLLLPDAPISEVDEALVNALKTQAFPVQAFVARYASEGVLERVREIASNQPGFPCGPLLRYFFRVDPAWAVQQLADARQQRKGGCPLYVSTFESAEDGATSPGLELAAIDDLRSPYPVIQNNAQKLLQYIGSADAKQSLWDAWQRLNGVVQDRDRQMLEGSLIDALSKARGWVLTSQELDRLTAECRFGCRQKVDNIRTALQAPILITPIPLATLDNAWVGPFVLQSREQLESKIAQFPRGTQFRFTSRVLDYPRTWLWGERTRQISAMLDGAGMKVVDP